MLTPRRASPEQLDAFSHYLDGVADVAAVEYVSEQSLADMPDGFALDMRTGRRVQVYVTPGFSTDFPAGDIEHRLALWRVADAIAARDWVKVTTAGLDHPVVQCADCRTSMHGSPYEPDPVFCQGCQPSSQ